MNHGIRFGILCGVVSIALIYVAYFINPEYIYSYILTLIVHPIFHIACIVLAVKTTRDELGGYATFKDLIKPAFTVVVLTNLIYFFGYYALYNFVDPSLPELEKQIAIEAMDSMAEMFDLPEDAMDSMEEEIDKLDEMDNTYTISKAMWSYLLSVIWGFIPAAIVSAIFKRQAPLSVYDETVNETL